MADIGLRYLVLEDRWPGVVNPNLSKPTDGWDNTVDCCVTAPTYPIGTKILGYDDVSTNPGSYTMMYLARADGSWITDHTASTGNLGGFSVAGMICARQCGTTADDNTNAPYYYVTGDCTESDATRGYSAAAIACGSMADADNTNSGAQFGWFWVGGVCPVTDNTFLDVTVTTGGAVTNVLGVKLDDDGTNGIFLEGILDGTHETSSVGYFVWTDA
ncbi:MAG: hypothetical protein KAS32_11470 [Candidatus Peribacteraceae bacterium]|nr:hypothetical protein [Candidatus Peribacteraceae bacterium]